MAQQTKSVSRSIYLDTQAAQVQMQNLVAAGDKLKMKINEGELAGKSMIKELGKLNEINSKIKSVQDQLDSGLKPTLQQQQNLVRQLNNELARMSENNPAFKEKAAIYQKQNKILQQMRSRIQGVRDAQKELNDHTTGFGKVFTHVAEAAASWFAIEKVVDGVKDVFKESIEVAQHAEESFSRLQNILHNIGREDVLPRIQENVENLSKSFKYLEPADIQDAFTKLITYGKLTERQINDLLPVIINFAAQQKITVPEATGIFTKALEGNARALKEYGINIKDGHDVTERFGILMTELKPRVEGAADAFGKTMKGQLAIAKQELRETQEQIGNGLIPVLTSLLKVTVSAIKGIGDTFWLVQKVTNPSAYASHKAEEALNQIKENNEKYENGLIESYSKDKNGKARSNEEIAKLLERDKKFDEKQAELASIAGDVQKQAMYEQSIKNTEAAIEKLKERANPDLDKVLGLGAGKGDQDAAAKKYAEGRKQFQDLIDKMNESVAKDTLSPMEAAFVRINIELKKNIELIEDFRKRGIITNKEASTALELARTKALEDSNKAYNEADIAARKKRTGTISTPLLQLNDKDIETAMRQLGDKELAAAMKESKRIIDAFNKDKSAGIELDVLKFGTKGTDPNRNKEYEALKAQLLQNEKLELDAAGLTENEKQVIYEKYRQKRQQLDDDFQSQTIKTVELSLDYAKQSLGILSTIDHAKTTMENKQLALQMRNADIAKNYVNRLEGQKVITKQEAAARTIAIEQNMDKAKRTLEMQQWERNRKIQIAQALVNGAMGITSALAARPGAADIISLGAFRAIQIAFTIATTAAQIANISAQKPQFARGGYLPGPSHAEGGLPVINPRTGQAVAEVEGGEAILSKNTVRNNKGIVSALLQSSMYYNGQPINLPWVGRGYQSLDFAAIGKGYKKFATGGIYGDVSNQGNADNAAAQSINNTNQINAALVQTISNLTDRLNQPINTYMTLKQMSDANTRQAQILSNAKISS